MANTMIYWQNPAKCQLRSSSFVITNFAELQVVKPLFVTIVIYRYIKIIFQNRIVIKIVIFSSLKSDRYKNLCEMKRISDR